MQEKPTTVAAYAAGASLAAVALFYVFGPNYTIDGDESNDSNRKKSIGAAGVSRVRGSASLPDPRAAPAPTGRTGDIPYTTER